MSDLKQNEAAARQCVELFNRKDLNTWVETCYTETVEWIELPRQTTPQGQRGNREAYLQNARRVLAFTPDRRMEIRNLVAQGDQVVLEVDWKGTTAQTMANLPAGTLIHYRVANFLTLAGGKIVKQVDYCIPLFGMKMEI
jgi:ketosteroid isomerase-like protein